jgi:hypothetical protein
MNVGLKIYRLLPSRLRDTQLLHEDVLSSGPTGVRPRAFFAR